MFTTAFFMGQIENHILNLFSLAAIVSEIMILPNSIGVLFKEFAANFGEIIELRLFLTTNYPVFSRQLVGKNDFATDSID